jgi:MFS family permease
MPSPSKSRYEVTAYIIVTVIIGTLIGVLIGAMFADTDAGRASVGIVAAFVAVAAEILIRRYLGRSLPQFFLSDRERNAPLSVWVGAFVTAVAAGLATSSIGQVMGIQDSMMIGLLAGLFAGLITAVLVVLHDHEANLRRGSRRTVDDAV